MHIGDGAGSFFDGAWDKIRGLPWGFVQALAIVGDGEKAMAALASRAGNVWFGTDVYTPTETALPRTFKNSLDMEFALVPKGK